jgi:hypothetical protein
VRIASLPAASTLRSASFRYVFDGNVLYLRFPDELRDTWPQGKRWARYEASKAAPGARSFDQFFQSPRQQVEMLTALRPDVTEAGHERVRGADTTRYQAKVDLRGAYESMRAKLKRDTLPVVVWIDRDGRVRRLLFSFRAETGQTAATTTMTLELHGFGAAVSVRPPSADEVADLTAA